VVAPGKEAARFFWVGGRVGVAEREGGRVGSCTREISSVPTTGIATKASSVAAAAAASA
jgi:hypothetical protein